VELQLQIHLNSALGGRGHLHILAVDRLANDTVGAVGAVASVEPVQKRQISSHNGIRNFTVSQATAQHYTDRATPNTIYNSTII
jgi:hypothetical protein